MGRGQGPQGGAGNQGGALSSKSSKSRKPKANLSTRKDKVAASGPPGEEIEQPAHTVVRPSPQQRAELLRGQRRDEAAVARLAVNKMISARQWDGTSPTGEVLGGLSVLDLADLREARLQHLTKQHQERGAEQPSMKREVKEQGDKPHLARHDGGSQSSICSCAMARPAAALAVAELLPMRRRLDQRMGESEAAGVGCDWHSELAVRVLVLLDMLAGRLGQDQVEHTVKLLCTVLENALKEDPKYRRLKAGNEKLWMVLLQHPEICALIEVTGFEQQFGTDEIDRQTEMQRIQCLLQEQLEGPRPSGQAMVDSLLYQLEKLEVASSPPGPEAIERHAVFVHSGGAAMKDLPAALEATSRWLLRFRETPDGPAVV